MFYTTTKKQIFTDTMNMLHYKTNNNEQNL